MADLTQMNKADVVAYARKLTQELKRLTKENEELLAKVDNTIQKTDALSIDSVAMACVKNLDGTIEVHILDYDSKSGQGVVTDKRIFDKMHFAYYEANKLFHTKLLGE